MTKRYAIIGDVIAEALNATLRPGGSGAIALAIAMLGGSIKLRSVLATDGTGKEVLAALKQARIHPGLIDRIDGATTAIVRRNKDGEVIERRDGIGIKKGAIMDIYGLFGHDSLVLDVRDQSLRRFLSDLPAHTDGNVRMVGTLGHLDWNEPSVDEMEIALRFDAIVGTAAQYAKLTGCSTPTDALGDIFDRMPGAHLRAAAAITPDGLELIAREDRVLRPIQRAIPDLLLPQAVAGIAWGFAHRADWDIAATAAADPSQINR
jgi:hypothetical protein